MHCNRTDIRMPQNALDNLRRGMNSVEIRSESASETVPALHLSPRSARAGFIRGKRDRHVQRHFIHAFFERLLMSQHCNATRIFTRWVRFALTNYSRPAPICRWRTDLPKFGNRSVQFDAYSCQTARGCFNIDNPGLALMPIRWVHE